MLEDLELDNIFRGVFDGSAQSVINVNLFLIVLFVSLLIGGLFAFCYTVKTSRYTKSFLITLFILPSIVCVVIMMVNGNVGAGVAVAGAFSLVRFRSIPGSAKEIAVLFMAMATGLIMGMGYIAFGVLFAIIMCAVLVVCSVIKFPKKFKKLQEKSLRITVPEDLNYANLFDDIFQKYLNECNLVNVKTTNLGTLFRLTYDITEKDQSLEKEMVDALRVRNGNLEIQIMEREVRNEEL